MPHTSRGLTTSPENSQPQPCPPTTHSVIPPMPTMTPAKTVSAIIPTRGRLDDLRRCITSIQAQDYPNIEIIVVDDQSEDDTPETIQQEYPTVTVLRNAQRLGARLSRGAGIDHASGAFIHFLDNDTELLTPDTVSTMVRILDSDPTIAVVGGEMHDTGRGVEFKFKCMSLNGEPLTRYAPPTETLLRDCDYVATCNCMTRRAILDRLRPFRDPPIRQGHDRMAAYGDAFLGYVVKRAGKRSIFDSRCVADHHVSPTARSLTFYDVHRSRIYMVLTAYPWYAAALLPILDVINVFSPGKLTFLFIGKPDLSRFTPGRRAEGSVRNALTIAVKYALDGLRAYAWHLPRLAETLSDRRNVQRRFKSASADAALSDDLSRPSHNAEHHGP